MASPASCAVTCSKVFPHCAYTAGAGDEDTVINAWLDHVLERHGNAHPAAPSISLKAALTFA